VGGGIGGLAVAIGLRQAGWEVIVFERAAGQPEVGTALGIWPEALRALDRLGLGKRARQTGCRPANGAILRPDGSRIATIDGGRLERRTGDGVYLLSRPALLGLLAGALPAGVVRYGCEVSEVDGLPRGYDVVVGADGLHSQVRRAVFGARYRPRYAGSTAWRGTVALDLGADGGGETWGRGHRFGITPQEPGRTNWYATAEVAEGYVPGGGKVVELRARFGRWHACVRQILDRLTESEILQHDLYDLDPPLPSFVHGNVALLGDAAHAMTPDLGQGACQALVDGVALAGCLAAGADVAKGLRAYDRLRRRPAQRIAAMSRRVNRLASVRRLTPLRDLAVRAALRAGPPA
jgi:2-polyprenyl-6-methoxyphenol hydroxylase-like FAD-dependent oxidoreductase